MGLNRRLKSLLLCSVATTSMLAGGQALAQDQITRSGKGYVSLLERLVIGAGNEKVAIDTPQAVTVVDQEDIDREQATSTGDLLDSVPGLTMIGSDRVLGESFNIRGIGTAETSGDEAKIIITVDGAKKFYEQYRMGSFFSDPELYKQVEVLRGPASSTLYGSGAIGGVINFVTKDASDFIAEGKTGAFRIKGGFVSNGMGTLISPLWAQKIGDNLEILATGNFRRSDEMTLAEGSVLLGSDFEAWSGLAKGTARFGDNNEQALRLSYQQWDSNATDQEYNQTGSAAGFGLVDRHVIDRTTVLSYENPAAKTDLLDLKAMISYSDTEVDQTGSMIGGFANGHYAYQTLQGSVENTSEAHGEGWDNYLTLGILGSYQSRVGYTNGTNAPISTHPEGTDAKLALYAQDEFIWGPLTVIPGIRAEFIHQEPDSTVPGGAIRDDVALSPKLAALFDVNDNISVFGSLARTERFPTLDELYQSRAPSQTPSPNLMKEEAINIEGGVALHKDGILTETDTAAIKATVFYTDLTNLIAVTPSSAGSPRPYMSNIQDAHIYGVEIEASYDAEMFFGRAAITAIDGYDNGTGLRLNSIPAPKAVLTAGVRLPEYRLEIGGKVTLAAAIDTGVVSANTQNTTPPPPAPQPATEGTDAYAVVDLFLNWKPQYGFLDGTEVRLGIDNLFNADYRDNQSPDRSKARTFKVTLSKQFDY